MKRQVASSGMRSIITAIAAFGAIALTLASAASAAVEREEVSTVTVPRQGEKVIVISNSRGDVEVIGERGRGDISIEIRKVVKARANEEATRLFAAMELEVAHEGRELKVSARYPEEIRRDRSLIGYIMQQYPSIRMDINLRVPAGLNVKTITSSGDVQLSSIDGIVDATSASGDLEITDIGGGAQVKVASGDVSMARIGGDVSATSASGDFEGEDIKGSAVIQSSSGDIDLTGLGGDLTATSTSGDVTVDSVGGVVFNGTSGSATFTGVRGGVTANVTSGDIEVSGSPASPVNYEIRTSSGEITLQLEVELPGGFVLKARTTTGDISVVLPIEVTKAGRHELAGIVRGGKSLVVLETASGDITVTEPEE